MRTFFNAALAVKPRTMHLLLSAALVLKGIWLGLHATQISSTRLVVAALVLGLVHVVAEEFFKEAKLIN